MPRNRSPHGGRLGLAASAVAIATFLGACAPGASPTASPPASQAAAATASAQASVPAASTSAAASPAASPSLTDLGTVPITLTVMTDNSPSDEASITELGKAFTAKYPNVTVKMVSEQFTVLQQNGPRIISGDSAPDLIRFPTLGTTVKDGLLTNLDPYAAAYGWDKFPATQLDQWRVSPDGLLRGSGSLYGMGLSFSLTGVYYNKKLASSIGMTQPPASVADLEALMEKAKATGKTPMLTSGQDGAYFWLFQVLMLGDGAQKQLADWTFNVPNATIEGPSAELAATKIQEWTNKGYFPKDAVAINNTEASARFAKGDAVFYFDGNWDAGTYNKALGDNVGFFLMPPTTAGGKYSTMSDPINYVIPAKAKNANAAAAFLNFAFTEAGRNIMVETTGQVPGGPADAAPPTTGAGPVITDTLTAFAKLNADDGICPYIGNATASIYTDTIIPQFQLLATGKVTPADFVKKMQSDYQSQLGR